MHLEPARREEDRVKPRTEQAAERSKEMWISEAYPEKGEKVN